MSDEKEKLDKHISNSTVLATMNTVQSEGIEKITKLVEEFASNDAAFLEVINSNQNTAVKAGFLAELMQKETFNADAIRKNSTRRATTDKFPEFSDLQIEDIDGSIRNLTHNDTSVDIVVYDTKTNQVKHTAQVKIYKNSKETLKAFEYDKQGKLTQDGITDYTRNDTLLAAEDQVGEIKDLAHKKSLKESLTRPEVSKQNKLIEEKTRANIEQDGVKSKEFTKKEYEEATRDNGKRREKYQQEYKDDNLKEMLKNSAVTTAAITSVISGVANSIKYISKYKKGEITSKEAAVLIVKDTALATAKSTSITVASATITHQLVAKKAVSVATSKGLNSAVTAGFTLAFDSAKEIFKVMQGEQDGLDALVNIGENGTGTLSATMFSTAFTSVAVFAAKSSGIAALSSGIGMSAVGILSGFGGAMIGYALASAFYGELVNSMKAAKFAKAERERIERECAEAIEMIKAYRAELQANINAYLSDHIAEFDRAFSRMSDMYKLGDIDGFIKNANLLTENLGGETQFKDFDEFNALIEKGETIII
ncbi:MAG: hypothetical protein IJT33_02590 [Campylobacter sp.]|nr:hypothetical protein [Campylobacter sp.]MBQ7675331.1 hypothetical protein [Campylobacter sp.]MBQ9877221.1 hypothetical protein [Campylobacter sp.]